MPKHKKATKANGPPTTQKTVDRPSPAAAKAAWLEAIEAKKITSLRAKRQRAYVQKVEQDIRHADANSSLTGAGSQVMADLARRLAKAIERAEAAEAADHRVAEEVKAAWKAWEPFANIEAEGDAPRIPRVAHMIEKHRREEAAKIPRADGRADPTIAVGPGPKAAALKAASAQEMPRAAARKA